MPAPQRVKVCLASKYAGNALRRQTPKGDLVWNNTHVVVNDEQGCSWLCVFANPLGKWQTTIPRHRRIAIVTEPTIYNHYGYSMFYFWQFGIVISPYRRPLFYRGLWLREAPYITWHYGEKKGLKKHERPPPLPPLWDDIKKPKKKTKLLSVVCSRKSSGRFQRQRPLFIDALKRELGTQLDVYGIDSNFITDKADAIDPYRYHLALENNQDKHFWTEKLADCYLGEAYPIYAGCKNVHDYFPRQAYTPIDIFNIPQAIQQVKDIIASDLWQTNRAHILEAKRRVMEEHQLYPVIDRIIRAHDHACEPFQPLPTPVPIKRGANFGSFPIEQRYRYYTSYDYWSQRRQKWCKSIKKRYPFS